MLLISVAGYHRYYLCVSTVGRGSSFYTKHNTGGEPKAEMACLGVTLTCEIRARGSKPLFFCISTQGLPPFPMMCRACDMVGTLRRRDGRAALRVQFMVASWHC
jgi:hypothetical protein